ncbi:MAG: hypothetical protein HKM23_00965 [Nitrosopumilus sp.]|nr:hypothetical protein [Nitrosopumilus sp.]NNL58462.1 hypothetical protein [Nitrosopumilus sp.]
MKFNFIFLILILVPGLSEIAYAHTVDSVGEYRVEIGWMNEPVVSGETNAIEFYASPLVPGLELKEQVFNNGIEGLKNSVKIQLVYKDESIILPLSPDHNVPGKYYAFVNPTLAGFYQANILGTINDTSISLSMHPPKVEEREWIEFPQPSDLTLNQIIDGHTSLIAEIHDLKESVNSLQESKQMDIGYVGVMMGIIGIVIASFAFVKSKK